MSEQKIYVLLSDTGTWLSKTIKNYTGAPYNHASISLDKNLDKLYSFGRKKINNPFYGGFLREDVVRGVFRKFPNTECVLYELEVTKREFEKAQRIIAEFEKKEEFYIYNFVGLFGVLIKKPIGNEFSYFCSQFVAEVIKRAGIKLWDKHPGLVAPDDFRKSNKLNKVYEGKLYEYGPVIEKVANYPEEDLKITLKEGYIDPIDLSLRAGIFKDPNFSLRKDFFYPLKDEIKKSVYGDGNEEDEEDEEKENLGEEKNIIDLHKKKKNNE